MTAGLVCEGLSQLTGGHSAGFWVSFRNTAATLLCAEVIFTVTTAKPSVTLWQPLMRRNNLLSPRAEGHNKLIDI